MDFKKLVDSLSLYLSNNGFNLELTPSELLPSLTLIGYNEEAKEHISHPLSYSTGGIIQFSYVDQYSDRDSFLKISEKVKTLITLLNGQDELIKALDQSLNLSRINFNSRNLELFTTEKANEFYADWAINFEVFTA